jgi:hypothetical protein
MMDLQSILGRVAPHNHVLILGVSVQESAGCPSIHDKSTCKKPFIAVNVHLSQKTYWKVNYSVMKKELSQMQNHRARASELAAGGHCFWMKSGNSDSLRQNCCLSEIGEIRRVGEQKIYY